MATFNILGIAMGPTTAQIGGTFEGGDANYSYQRFIRVTLSGYGTFDIYSDQTSGGYNTFAQTITGLSPGTTYTWSAVLYVRVSGGWSATTYTDSGSFTTEAAAYYLRLNFDANGGTGAPAAVTGQSTDGTGYVTVTIPYTEPTRSGFVFVGWATNTGGTGTIRYPGGTYTGYGNTTSYANHYLYAVWRAASYSVTVKYNANGGSGAPSSHTVTGNTSSLTVTLSSVKPTRSGYTFMGWATSETATTAAYYAGQTLTNVYATAAGYTWNLYAVWSKESTGLARIGVGLDKAKPYIWNGGWKKAASHGWDGRWQKGI